MHPSVFFIHLFFHLFCLIANFDILIGTKSKFSNKIIYFFKIKKFFIIEVIETIISSLELIRVEKVELGR